jgi:hypothetical protein
METLLLILGAGYLIYHASQEQSPAILPPQVSTPILPPPGSVITSPIVTTGTIVTPPKTYEEIAEENGTVPPGFYSDPDNFKYRNSDIDKIVAQYKSDGKPGVLQSLLMESMLKHLSSNQIQMIYDALGVKNDPEIDDYMETYNYYAEKARQMNAAGLGENGLAPITSYKLNTFSNWGGDPMIELHWMLSYVDGNTRDYQDVKTIADFKKMVIATAERLAEKTKDWSKVFWMHF